MPGCLAHFRCRPYNADSSGLCGSLLHGCLVPYRQLHRHRLSRLYLFTLIKECRDWELEVR